jgi:hypothetical protein
MQRQDTEQAFIYRQMTDGQLMEVLQHYPSSPALVREAARRGLITLAPQPQPPGLDCTTLSLGQGDFATDCR